jgi:Sulfatase
VTARFAGRSLPIVLHPLAVPIAAIIHWWSSTALPATLLVRPLVIVILVGLVTIAVATLIVRDRNLAGIAALAVLTAVTVDDRRAFVLLLVVAAIVIAVGISWRDVAWPRGPAATRFLSTVAAILVLTSVIDSIQTGAIGYAFEDIRRDLAAEGPAEGFADGAPDIYVFLLDGYPGRSAAMTEPAFDSAGIIAALRTRGFDVARDARSNYVSTRVTLPSVFSAAHLPDITSLREPGTRQRDAHVLREATESGVVLRTLGAAGYERIAVASGYGEIGPLRVDRLIAPPQVGEFEASLLRSTMVGSIVDFLAPDAAASQKHERVVATFQEAVTLARERHERPRFVFVHVPAPHGPWVVDAAGNAFPGTSTLFASFADPIKDPETRRNRYFEFSAYVANRTVATVDAILAASPRPPIIVLFSDHGPDISFDSNDPLSSDLDQRSSNLIAVLAPGHPDLLPDDATTVNIFPMVLNAYLGTDLAIQPNTFWAWRTGSSILDFVELDPRTWKAK